MRKKKTLTVSEGLQQNPKNENSDRKEKHKKKNII